MYRSRVTSTHLCCQIQSQDPVLYVVLSHSNKTISMVKDRSQTDPFVFSCERSNHVEPVMMSNFDTSEGLIKLGDFLV